MGLLLLQGASDLNPRELFASGEQGLWLDPSQMSTLYQDSNGVTPCTAAGDPVGLILDQSRGGLSQIGADLVTNGTFAADSDWTKGANWTIGSGVATKTGGAANNLTQTIGSTAAAWYRISLDVTRSAGTLTVSLGTSGTTYAITATGSYTFFILAGSGTQTLTLAGDSSFAGTVDNVVVKNVPGNHAYQTTSASRPTLARIPSSGRRNLLTRTEELSNATAWAQTNTLNGSFVSGVATVTDVEGYTYATQSGTYSTTTDHAISFDVTCNQTIANVPLRVAGTVSVSTLANLTAGQTVRVTLTGYRPFAGSLQIGLDLRDAVVPGGSNATGYTVTFNRVQLETGSSVSNYQKVVATSDVSESGFADLYHLVFDGSDDSLVTNSVDFSATDEMTVIAGVRKLPLGANAYGGLLELGTNTGSGGNPGSFAVWKAFSENNWFFQLRGSTGYHSGEHVGALTSPITNVVTCVMDLSQSTMLTELLPRINGADVTYNPSGVESGTGNFGSYQFFIGRRNQSSVPFTGHIYQLIVRGKTTPTGKLLEAERYTAKRTGVTGI